MDTRTSRFLRRAQVTLVALFLLLTLGLLAAAVWRSKELSTSQRLCLSAGLTAIAALLAGVGGAA